MKGYNTQYGWHEVNTTEIKEFVNEEEANEYLDEID